MANRGAYFSVDEQHPNVIAPGKRPAHTLMASMALKDRRPWLVFGTMGGEGQPQTNVQVLLRVLAGASPADAVAAPRVLSGQLFPGDDDDQLHVEEDLGSEVIAELRRLGNDVTVVPTHNEMMGHAHAILIDGDRIQAGADPRSDGSAVVHRNNDRTRCRAPGRGDRVSAHESDWRPVVASDGVDCWNDAADVIVDRLGSIRSRCRRDGRRRGRKRDRLGKGGRDRRHNTKIRWQLLGSGQPSHAGLGLADSRDGALRYMARSSRPQLYSPDAPNLGLPQWEYDGICLFVDEGPKAFADLERIGAFATLPLRDSRNFYSELDEDVHKLGRTVAVRDPDGGPADGPELIRQLVEALEKRGGRIELEHRVVSVVDG